MGENQDQSLLECSPEEYVHYKRWYNMPEGPEKERTGPLIPSFSSLDPPHRFRRIQYLHFRTWCNLHDEEEKNRMQKLIQPPPVSNYAERYPFRESHLWDALALTPRERYACWEQASLHTFFCLMYRNKIIKPLCKIIIEFINPYTTQNIVNARIRAEEKVVNDELARVRDKQPREDLRLFR